MEWTTALGLLVGCAGAMLALYARQRARTLGFEQGRLRRGAGMAAADLRQIVLRVHGTAGRAADPALQSVGVACRAIAEDLAALAHTTRTPILDEDTVSVQAAVTDAVDATAAAIAPGRRVFQVNVPPRAALRCDRRALNQVLTRALCEAVLNTRERDAIGISLEQAANGGMVLVVDDEGHGLGLASHHAPGDSRGLCGRMWLPHALMQAHDGELQMLAAPGAGTRTLLTFPPSRVRHLERPATRGAMLVEGSPLAESHQ
jgi:hypothetical protein